MNEDNFVKFWSNTDVKDGCWEWLGGKATNGYGMMWDGEKKLYSHRVSFELFNGEIKEKCICHTCDNRGCVNPKHLWQGSYKDNINDAVIKGRMRQGLKVGKFTGEQIKQIRQKYKPRKNSLGKVAKEYGVSRACIYFIVTKQHYKYI
jgi:hypothetical protein